MGVNTTVYVATMYALCPRNYSFDGKFYKNSNPLHRLCLSQVTLCPPALKPGLQLLTPSLLRWLDTAQIACAKHKQALSSGNCQLICLLLVHIFLLLILYVLLRSLKNHCRTIPSSAYTRSSLAITSVLGFLQGWWCGDSIAFIDKSHDSSMTYNIRMANSEQAIF